MITSLISGFGETVIDTSKGSPSHPSVHGVTSKTIVSSAEGFVLSNTPESNWWDQRTHDHRCFLKPSYPTPLSVEYPLVSTAFGQYKPPVLKTYSEEEYVISLHSASTPLFSGQFRKPFALIPPPLLRG